MWVGYINARHQMDDQAEAPLTVAANDPVVDPPARRRRLLGDLLVEAGLVDERQLERALAYQRIHGGRLGGVLVTMGILSEEDLASSLGRQLGLAACDVESINPAPDVLKLVPEVLIRRYEVIPLGVRGGTLVVGMTDPSNGAAIDEIKLRTRHLKFEARLVTETTFRRFVATRFSAATLMDQIAADEALDAVALSPGRPGQRREGGEEIARRVRSADPEASLPLVSRLTNYLLRQALEQGASAIHVEPYETFFRVRFRVDGKLRTELTPGQRLHGPLVSRLKILSEMDVSERRKPQQGQMSVRLDGADVQLHVSTLPTVFGEKCVVRVIKKETHLADLARLGMSGEQLARVQQVARLPEGLVLVTGGIGSGKTTSLRAVVNHVNDPDLDIVMLEQAVTETVPGANHVAIPREQGGGFSETLRAVIAQDPDVVVVDELSDSDTGSLVVRSALSGKLVFVALPTHSGVDGLVRLLDMGLEPWLVARSLQLVMNQRLLRRLCPACAVTVPLPAETIAEFQLTPQQVDTALHRVAEGCRDCQQSGYRGRVAVFEMITPDAALYEAIRSRASEEVLVANAVNATPSTLWEMGVARALAGETSFDEVRRVLPIATHHPRADRPS
jgi:type II secretory ATPase GspE/PulE/Tfp pilus assembly ATPase PilB-like protein